MYKTWIASRNEPEELARDLEVHLNEYAGEVITVAYAVDGAHHVLAVYREIEISTASAESEAALSAVDQLLDEHQA